MPCINFNVHIFFSGPRSGPFQSMGIMAQFLLNLERILWNELRSAFFVLVSNSKALRLLKQFFNPSPNEKACHLNLPYNYTNNTFFYRDVFTYLHSLVKKPKMPPGERIITKWHLLTTLQGAKAGKHR